MTTALTVCVEQRALYRPTGEWRRTDGQRRRHNESSVLSPVLCPSLSWFVAVTVGPLYHCSRTRSSLDQRWFVLFLKINQGWSRVRRVGSWLQQKVVGLCTCTFTWRQKRGQPPRDSGCFLRTRKPS